VVIVYGRAGAYSDQTLGETVAADRDPTVGRHLVVDKIVGPAAGGTEVKSNTVKLVCNMVKLVEACRERGSIALLDALVLAALPLAVRAVRDRGAMQLVGRQFRAGDDAPPSTARVAAFYARFCWCFEAANQAGWCMVAAEANTGLQGVAALAFATY
jgi:hypothetical protein